MRRDEVVGILLALFLGGFGMHHFYLRRTGLGILYCCFCWTRIPWILGFIECFFMPGRVREFNAIQAAGIAAALGIAVPGWGQPANVNGEHAARAAVARPGTRSRPARAASRPTRRARGSAPGASALASLRRQSCAVMQSLHIRVPGAHRLVELRLGEVQRGFRAAWYSAARAISCGRGRGKLAVQHHQPLARLIPRHAQQVGLGRVQILRVARVGNPHRLALAQHAGEPVDLAAAGSPAAPCRWSR